MRHLPRRETRDRMEVLRPESFRRREDTCTVPEMALYLATSLLPVLQRGSTGARMLSMRTSQFRPVLSRWRRRSSRAFPMC